MCVYDVCRCVGIQYVGKNWKLQKNSFNVAAEGTALIFCKCIHMPALSIEIWTALYIDEFSTRVVATARFRTQHPCRPPFASGTRAESVSTTLCRYDVELLVIVSATLDIQAVKLQMFNFLFYKNDVQMISLSYQISPLENDWLIH